MNGPQGGGSKVTSSFGVDNRRNVSSEENAVGETKDGRQVVKTNAEAYLSKPAAGSSGPTPTTLTQRTIAKQKDQALDLQQCLFQHQVVDALVSDQKISEGLTVYYVDPDGRSVAVDPPDKDSELDSDITKSYWDSRQKLKSQGETLKALCAEQLTHAKKLTSEAGSPDLNTTGDHDFVPISFNHLFTMLEEHQEGGVLQPTGGNHEDDGQEDFKVQSDKKVREDNKSADSTGDNTGIIEAVPQNIPTTSNFHPENDKEEELSNEGQPKTAIASEYSDVETERNEEEVPTEGVGRLPNNLQETTDNINGKDEDTLGQGASTPALLSSTPQTSFLKGTNELEKKQLIAPTMKDPAAETEHNEEEVPTEGVDRSQNNLPETTDNINGKNEDTPGQGANTSDLLSSTPQTSFLEDTKELEKKRPITPTMKDPSVGGGVKRYEQVLKELEQVGSSLERGLLEILRSTITDVEQSEKALLDKLRELDQSERYRLLDSSQLDPPDGTEKELQKSDYRTQHISELDKCLKKLQDANAEDRAPINKLIGFIGKKKQFWEKLNDLAQKEAAWIEQELSATCEKDIGVEGTKKISQALALVKGKSVYDGSLKDIVTAIGSCNEPDELQDALQKKLNLNIIPSIIGDSEPKNNTDVLPRVKSARVSRLVQATAQVLIEKAQNEMKVIEGESNNGLERIDKIRVVRDKYVLALKQLKTDHWGRGLDGALAKQIYAPCIDHINNSVDAAVQALHEEAKSHPLIESKNNGVFTELVKQVLDTVKVDGYEDGQEKIDQLNQTSKNEDELQRVVTLINQDSDFCKGLVATFTSLKDNFAGKGPAGGEYEQRSADVMKALRMNHGLTDALSAPAVLQAVILDVSSPDSQLMPHFNAHHGGKNKKGTELRNEKVIRQAVGFLTKEPIPADRKLFNQTARACFRDNALYDDTGQENRDTIFGQFLEGVKGAKVIKMPDTDDVHINTGAIVNGKPLLFSGKPLSADLMGSRWLVDPGFFIDDHPDISIPFETSDGTSRDWISLTDSQSGKTAILAMSKKAGSPQPFFYQLSDDNQWVCHSLGASGNPSEADEEVFQGTLFAMAACGAGGDEKQAEALAVDAQRIYKKIHDGSTEDNYHNRINSELTALNRGANKWVETDQLVQRLTKQAVDIWKEKTQSPHKRIVTSSGNAYQFVKADTLMKEVALDKPQAFQIYKAKAAKRSDKRQGNVVEEIKEWGSAFEAFGRPATYDVMTKRMVETLKREYANHNGMLKRIEQIEEEVAEYGDKAANPELFAFKGCIIGDDSYDKQLLFTQPLSGLKEVISKSRQHNALLFQERAHMKRTIQNLLNKGKANDTLRRNIFDLAIKEFERNEIPGHLSPDDQKNYIKSMANYLLLDNACQLEHQQLQGKLKLLDKLEALESKKHGMSQEAFDLERKQWNLEMALIAGQQQVINTQLNHYCNESLDSKNLARLSFECRAKTVLRSNQVTEVNEAVEDISKALASNDTDGMKRVSQKGTGWGKSTVVKMLSDYACAQIKELPPEIGVKRSVMVIAPKSNQAELDISLGQYFRQAGRNYQRLDMSAYTKKASWWRGDSLDRIHNTLLGLPPGTKVNDRQLAVKKMDRAPVGASIEDIQVLMQLRNALEKGVSSDKRNVDDAEALDKLNKISDLCRESMIFGDEWDSALMPPKIEMLDEIRDTVNAALSSVPKYNEVKTEDIRSGQSSFIMGAKRKHLLSATTGSTYLLLQATGLTDASQARVASHLGIEESNYRALRWINEADIIFCDETVEVEEEAARQVVERVGSEQGVLYMDARAEHSGKSDELADKVGTALQHAREAMKGQTEFSTLHYDEQKKIHKKSRHKKGQSQGSLMSAVEEEVARRNGGKGFDTVLSQRESVGTDAPQSAATPLVHVGLLAQTKEGRLDFVAQQLGRMRGDQVVRKQPKMLVVTKEELAGLQRGNAKNLAAINQATLSWDAMEQANKDLLSNNDLKSSPLVTKIINQPLSFSSRITSEEELNTALDLALNSSEKEWDGIPELKTCKAELKHFKKMQFIAQKDIKLVMAEELACRDRSDYTIQSEQSVQDAYKKAVAETVLSDQRNRLEAPIESLHSQSALLVGEKVVDAIRKIRDNSTESLSADIAKKLEDDEVSKLSGGISERIANSLKQAINSVPRDILPENAEEALEYARSGGEMPGKLETAITKVRQSIEEKNTERYVQSIDSEAQKQYIKQKESLEKMIKGQLADMSAAAKQMKSKCTITEITDRISKKLLSTLPRTIKALEEREVNKELTSVVKDMYKLREDMLSLVEKITLKKDNIAKDFIVDMIGKISGWENTQDLAIVFKFDPTKKNNARCRVEISPTNNGKGSTFKWGQPSTTRTELTVPTVERMKTTNDLKKLMADHAESKERYNEVAKVDEGIRAAVEKGVIEVEEKLKDSLVKQFRDRSGQQLDMLLSEEKLREHTMQGYDSKS